MKRCTKCQARKPASEYYIHRHWRSKATVPTSRCKDCIKRAVRMHRRHNESVREYDRERAKLPHRKVLKRETSDRWRKENPQGYRAHNALNNAVRDKKIKQQPCEVCGSARVHGHHRDYSKPLDVIWLCARHHHAAHGIVRSLAQ